MLQKLPQLLKVGVLYGFLFLTFGSLLEAMTSPTQNLAPVVAQTAAAAAVTQAPNLPAKLVIPRLGIELVIIPGTYDPANKTWTLSDTSLHFAEMTALPNGASGNTLLYGHNTDKVLAPTDKLTEGDTAELTTREGRIYTYSFTSGRLVDPSDTSVLEETSPHAQLTLLTCDGIWDDKRRLMSFDFVSMQ